MSDPAPIAARRRTGATIVALATLAFLAGLAIMAALVGRFGWFVPAPVTAHVQRVVATPAPAPVAAAPAPALDPATLSARAAALAAQYAALEARAAALTADADAAGGQAGRAESLLVAFAARRAIDAGMPLGALDPAFRARFAASRPRETAQIEEAAHHPVTLEDLRGGLEALSTNLLASDGGWWSALARDLTGLIVIHRADQPSPAPTDRIARIRRLVDSGRVEAALAEIGQMPGGGDAGAWIADARRYVLVHHALDAIEAGAIEAPAPPASATRAAAAAPPANG